MGMRVLHIRRFIYCTTQNLRHSQCQTFVNPSLHIITIPISHIHQLSSHGLFLLALLHVPFPLFLEILFLRFRIQALQFHISLHLLRFLTLQSPFFGLLFFIGFLQLTDHVFASCAHFAHDFGSEMGVLDEEIWEADEVFEEGQDTGVIS